MKIPIANLKNSFFVRKAINEDHVVHLALLLEGGQELPPIEVTPEHEIIDGRHRVEAHKLLKRTEIEYKVLSFTGSYTRAEQMAVAVNKNMGGALTQSPEDIRFAISQMLELGASEANITKWLSMPKGACRRYITDARAALSKRRLNAARVSIAGGATIGEAAGKHGVDPDTLRGAITGKRVKAGTINHKGILTTQYRSQSGKNAALFQKLVDQCVDGDYPLKKLNELFDHVENCINNQMASVSQWRMRLKTQMGGQ